jgi:hypothetical protein
MEPGRLGLIQADLWNTPPTMPPSPTLFHPL